MHPRLRLIVKYIVIATILIIIRLVVIAHRADLSPWWTILANLLLIVATVWLAVRLVRELQKEQQ